ncbi:hypothetical protein CDO52_09140 [Nocardiopsis gilva YIM 90087]|uniref:Peptidase C14 n=1 Tax=Nocardiopsis gilva YIM 90087 TaxID=1235441 RepID=A0A223S481_9ACTN|nr:AAA domain-containing protein [Nocardiopsis gilva]ASU82933.1 hypothetical protein CDO52_09140 [Nocardiopsis gilva YIM 90087]
MRRVAILIGTGKYRDPGLQNLLSPQADVAAIGGALEANGNFDEVISLLDPTHDEASGAIEQALNSGKPDDLVFVSFSGHGVRNTPGRLHLTFSDTRLDRVASTGLSSEGLQRMLHDSRVTKKVVLLDCCYSGSFADGFATRSSGEQEFIDFQREFLGGEGTYVLASSAPDKPAHEGDNSAGAQPSPFSAAVARGLSGEAEDVDGTGWIDWESLHKFVRAEAERDGRQRVTGFALGAVGRVPLARHVEAATAVRVDGGTSGRPAKPVHDDAGQGADRSDSGTPGAATGRAETSDDTGAAYTGGPHPDFDLRQWRSLFAYHRACLARQSVLQQLPDAKHKDGRQYAPCPMGKEALLSGIETRWRLTGAAETLARGAADGGRTLRYGYPAVVFDTAAHRPGKRAEWKVAPLFVMDVEAVADNGALYLTPVGEIELNAELAATAADLDPPDLDELTTWFRADWASGSLAKLGDKARSVCKVLDLTCVNDLEPGRLRAQLDLAIPLRSGAQNVALLYVADPAVGAAKQLISDLDVDGDHSIKPDQIEGTALAALTGRPAERTPSRQRVTPVITGLSNASQERILVSAMTRRLTVATGAPGTGKSELITSVVTSAVADGESVLVASTNNTAVDEVVTRANKLLPGADLVVRTGNSDERRNEPGILSDLRAARFDPVDVRTLAERLKGHERRLGEIRAELAAVAEAEYRLTALATARRRDIADLPPDLSPQIFSDADTVQRWTERVEKAVEGRWARWWHRWRLRRGLGRELRDDELRALWRFLVTEQQWRTARADLDARSAPDTLHHDANEIRTARRDDSAPFVVGQVAAALRHGHERIDHRLQALADNKQWKGVSSLLQVVRAWATTSRSVRVFPPQAGLFDLVVIDEASQCTVADLIPLLFRAKRALVIGDPHQLQPVHTLDPAEDRRAQREADISEEWLEDRSLTHSSGSAYHAAATALASAGGEVMWLDEHYRCHPDIVAPANRRFYGERLAIRTRTHKLKDPMDPAVDWVDVRGEAERPDGGSCRNLVEARHVISLLRELWSLPADTSIGVVTPFTAQRRAIEDLLGAAGRNRIRVGTVHTFQGGERDVIVVSPTAATGVDPRSGNWAASQHNLWNVAITRAKSRLYVVGDRSYWSGRDGVLAELARSNEKAGGSPLPDDAAREALFSALTERGVAVTVGRRLGGYSCDLSIPTGSGEIAVFIDRAGIDEAACDRGRALYRTLDLVALFEEVTGIPAVRVPAWRCLSDPKGVAADLLTQ